MKTRIKDFLDTSTRPWRPVYGFQFANAKRPVEDDWRNVDRGDGWVATWPTEQQRDQARACFTRRRSALAALADVRRLGLLPITTEGQR